MCPAKNTKIITTPVSLTWTATKRFRPGRSFAAIRGGRADIEFRGFPPKARDDLVKALGDKITVQESDWNCVLLFTPNHSVKPFDDPRVRRALTLAVDRYSGSKYCRGSPS